MTVDHDFESRVRDMLSERATDVPEGLTIPSHHDLDARRLARSVDSTRVYAIRRGWWIGAVAAAAVIAVVIVAIATADDKRTTITNVPPSTRTATPASTATPATPAVTQPFNEFPPKSSLAPGQPCPTTPRRLGNVIGLGNVALGAVFTQPPGTTTQVAARPDPNSGLGEIAVFWWAAPEQPGGFLVRGYQLDGNGSMQFNAGSKLEPSLVVTFSQSFAFGGMPQGWRHEPDIALYVDNSGCYAIDIEGTGGFREQLVINVVRT